MTKILYIPTGKILSFFVARSAKRTLEYEKSIYVVKDYDGERKNDLSTAKKFVWSLCNTDRHKFFKPYNQIPKDCVIEEFELIND